MNHNLEGNHMSRVNDKLMELEEEGVITWSTDINGYVLVEHILDPVPFDLAQYLFERHQMEDAADNDDEEPEFDVDVSEDLEPADEENYWS